MVNCQACELSYLQDKTTMLEHVARLIVNRLHESNTSAGTTYAQTQSVATINAFEEVWDKKACEHGGEIEKRGPGRPKKL